MSDPVDPADLDPRAYPPGVSPVVNQIRDLQTERWTRMVTLLIIGGPVLFALNVGIALKTHADNRHAVGLLSQGVACLLADMDDHRHTNQFAHEQLARHIPASETKSGHVEIEQPDVIPLTKEQADRLKEECDHFVKATLGVGPVFTGGQAEAGPHD